MAVTVSFLLCRAAADPGKCDSLSSQGALPLSGAKYLRYKDTQSEYVSSDITEGRVSRCLCIAFVQLGSRMGVVVHHVSHSHDTYFRW